VLVTTLQRDRAVVAVGLFGLVVLAWAYVVRMAAMTPAAMMPMPGMAMQGDPGLAWLVLMWGVMMIAMMLPSAAPTILLFASVSRRRRLQGQPAVPVLVFTFGYLLVWTIYAVAAATVQWDLHRLALLSPSMKSVSPVLAAGLLVAAGVYQWLPLKGACLWHCRSPLGFFAAEWREGTGGALLMGARHGSFCVGCCWLLMALLFVAGVMNLLWVAAIAGFVLLEKLIPGGAKLGKAAGVLLIVWGVWLLGTGGGT
jgi:predicted metal-binding membrane protein